VDAVRWTVSRSAFYKNDLLQLDIIANSLWERRSEEHTSELQSREKLVCRLLLEKKNREHEYSLSETIHLFLVWFPLQVFRDLFLPSSHGSLCCVCVYLSWILFPYTTLFRSWWTRSGGRSAEARSTRTTCFSWTSSQTASGKEDRKSTRLNSSHVKSSYAVFCLKKKIGNMSTLLVKPSISFSFGFLFRCLGTFSFLLLMVLFVVSVYI